MHGEVPYGPGTLGCPMQQLSASSFFYTIVRLVAAVAITIAAAIVGMWPFHGATRHTSAAVGAANRTKAIGTPSRTTTPHLFDERGIRGARYA
jgi:hypothetical protein